MNILFDLLDEVEIIECHGVNQISSDVDGAYFRGCPMITEVINTDFKGGGGMRESFVRLRRKTRLELLHFA